MSAERTGEPPGSRNERLVPCVGAVVLDETAIANLEITETLIGRRTQGSLLDVIDQTVTAPGARRLQQRRRHALHRQAASVQELVQSRVHERRPNMDQTPRRAALASLPALVIADC